MMEMTTSDDFEALAYQNSIKIANRCLRECILCTPEALNDLDEEIKPILKHLWQEDIKTYWSCAGHERDNWTAYISVSVDDKEFIHYCKDNFFDVRRNQAFPWIMAIYSYVTSATSNKAMRDHFLNKLLAFKKSSYH